MSETRRKLTTIFSADVQDYSLLMRRDEEGTLATLKRYRDAMARLIEVHGGRVINTWGDGVFAEFPSVVEALRAAIDVQNELAGYNGTSSPNEQMHFRIGLNLGDVIVEGDDLYGDGVNIAARLQACAVAGGIVISNTVYDQVRNKVAVGFNFLGQLEVKNIEGGVASYAVRIGDTSDAAPSPAVRPMQQAIPAPMSAAPTAPRSARLPRHYGVLAVVAVGLAAINLLTWQGAFWAVWPIFAMAMAAALNWAASNTRVDRRLASLAVVGIGLVCINALTWHGTFWAVWPLLGLAVVAGIRWVYRRSDI
jgi:class 3 adenylate cyclase